MVQPERDVKGELRDGQAQEIPGSKVTSSCFINRLYIIDYERVSMQT